MRPARGLSGRRLRKCTTVCVCGHGCGCDFCQEQEYVPEWEMGATVLESTGVREDSGGGTHASLVWTGGDCGEKRVLYCSAVN